MTRHEVIGKALAGSLTWLQAADVLGISPRQLRRLREMYEVFGKEALLDGRAGLARRRHIDDATIEEICRLKAERYADFSISHFHEQLAGHKIAASYTFVRDLLQLRGLVSKARSRGQYRRKRERRPLVGMMLHLDASTHAWLPDLPMQDLMVMLDDADGRILYARFVEQEGTAATLAALSHVLREHGRFCELYTDRGSHFCRTSVAGAGPDEEQTGQVSRVLRSLGIRQILARSPEARGRSERAFGTIQGRLPQELRLHRVRDYAEANSYLDTTFVPDFNRRFTVQPAQAGSAFVQLRGVDLTLLLTSQHERIVGKDNTVAFESLRLQLPQTRRGSLARCPVLVHELLDRSLVVAFQGRPVARFDAKGNQLPLLRAA